MSQGIVKVTPRPSVDGTITYGSLEIKTITDTTTYGVQVGDTLEFPNPGFNCPGGEKVECTITGAGKCTVTRIAQPKHHGHDAPPVPKEEDAQ